MTDTTQNNENKPSRRKHIITAVILLLCILTGYIYKVITWQPKPDPASEIIIRHAAANELGKDPNTLNDEDYAQITSLSLLINNSYNAFDIKLIEKFKNLKGLSIRGYMSSRTNMSAWKKILVKIHILSLDEKVFIDLSPLEKIKNLNALSLEHVQIKDLRPLNNHTDLHTLRLIGSTISNLKTIKKLNNLELLDLTKTNVVDIKPLKYLTSLKRLGLGQTKVSNLDSLGDLVNLRDLCLSETRIDNNDLNVLNKLPNLSVLYLGATKISNLEPLKGYKKLSVLHIEECTNIKDEQIKDLKMTLPKTIIYKIKSL